MKERIYQSYVRSAMLYGSETWCLRENEMAILRRTEKSMMRAMCKVKMIEKRRSRELMSLLSLTLFGPRDLRRAKSNVG